MTADTPAPERSTPGLRAAVAGLVLAFAALFVLNTFLPSPQSQAKAERYFSRADIERGLQFSTERKLLTWLGVGLQLTLLTALVCTTWARRLTDRLDRLTRRRWLLTLVLVAAVYLVLSELLAMPLRLANLELLRRWNMTERSVGAWLGDEAKSFVLNAAQLGVVLVGMYSLMHFFPRLWWLLAAAGATALGVLYAFLMPELIQPLFNRFTPLEDPYLRQRVKVLAARADVPVDEVLVMDASTRGRHTNAYFAGFGSTRRVVLYDTLLTSHSGVNAESVTGVAGLMTGTPGGGPWLASSQLVAARSQGDDEIETVLAHEVGHWRHDHIAKGIALASLAGLVGLFLLSRALRWAVGRKPFLLTGQADPAGVPLVLLLFFLASWVSLPVQNGVSRYFERQADAASLELARKPEAFIEAEKHLARDNLGNVAPTPFNTWMFATHPPTVERIEAAEEWKRSHK
jgi:STE24 endopeptidase